MPTQPISLKTIAEYHLCRFGPLDLNQCRMNVDKCLDDLELSEGGEETIQQAVSAYLLINLFIASHLTQEQLSNFGDVVDARYHFLLKQYDIRPLVVTPEQLEELRNGPKDITSLQSIQEYHSQGGPEESSDADGEGEEV